LRQIRATVDLEFGTLGALAMLTGAAGSLAASALFSEALLGVSWTVAWAPLATAAVLVPGVCVVTARAATRAVLRERPLPLLQSSEG
jgi:predicted lysophospholipase L1 biosynthesis ABC-type transport system permease subunit